MKDINITVKKDDVYEEVAKTSAYIGGKNVDGNGSSLYDKVFVTDVDKEMLERFWQDALNSISFLVSGILSHTDVDDDGNYTMSLMLPENFQMTQLPILHSTIVNYVENAIITEWCNVSAKDEVTAYAEQAAALLKQVRNLIYSRRRPIRNF